MIESSEIMRRKCDVITQLHHNAIPSITDRQVAYLDVIDEGINILESVDQEAEGIEKYRQQVLIYDWSEELKQYALLLRDVHHKAFKEEYQPNTLPDFDIISNTIKRAAHEVVSQLDAILRTDTVNEENLKLWKHQLSPAESITTQLHSIKEQINLIQESHDLMQGAERDILFYNTEIGRSIGSFDQNIDTLLNSITHVKHSLSLLNENPDVSSINTLTRQIDNAYETVDSLRGKAKINDWHFEGKHNIKVPVDTHEGNLVIKQVDFDNQINEWVDSDIVPSLLDMDGKVESLDYSTLTKIVNIKNQLLLIASNPELINNFEALDFESTFDDIIESAQAMKGEIEETQAQLQTILQKKLSISTVFDLNNYYLTKAPIPLITSYTREGNKWIGQLPIHKLKAWYTGIFDKYIASGSEEENQTQDQVDLIDFIKSRLLGNVDQYFHSLFYSKGFLGQTFYTPRQAFDEKYDLVLANWESGFPGSLLVYGRHLSGKSTLLESIGQNHKIYSVIQLKPEKEIIYNGHKIMTTQHIDETFKILDKYTRGDKVIVVIDDIENWGESKSTFLSEVNKLLQVITKNAKRYYFIVASNLFMKEDLDNYVDFSKHFISSYDATMMSIDNIASIIGVRHRASNKSDSIGYEESELIELTTKANRVAKNCNQVVGVSLIEWTREGDVKSKQKRTPRIFESVINANREVLRFILKWGAINEEDISKYKNPQVVKDMSKSIRELISLQILSRSIDSKLRIPDSLIDEVEEVIESQSKLKIEHYG